MRRRAIARFAWALLASAPMLAGCGSSSEARTDEPIVVDQPTGGEAPSEPTPETGEVSGRIVLGDDACTSDSDCVPADCCHAAACVARANAPSCGDVMCTMECRYGTIDCGGGCLCHEGRCAARLSEPPQELPH